MGRRNTELIIGTGRTSREGLDLSTSQIDMLKSVLDDLERFNDQAALNEGAGTIEIGLDGELRRRNTSGRRRPGSSATRDVSVARKRILFNPVKHSIVNPTKRVTVDPTKRVTVDPTKRVPVNDSKIFTVKDSCRSGVPARPASVKEVKHVLADPCKHVTVDPSKIGSLLAGNGTNGDVSQIIELLMQLLAERGGNSSSTGRIGTRDAFLVIPLSVDGMDD